MILKKFLTQESWENPHHHFSWWFRNIKIAEINTRAALQISQVESVCRFGVRCDACLLLSARTPTTQPITSSRLNEEERTDVKTISFLMTNEAVSASAGYTVLALFPTWLVCELKSLVNRGPIREHMPHTGFSRSLLDRSGEKQICLVTLSWSVTRGTTTLVTVNIVGKPSLAWPWPHHLVTFMECVSFQWKCIFLKCLLRSCKISQRMLPSLIKCKAVSLPFKLQLYHLNMFRALNIIAFMTRELLGF